MNYTLSQLQIFCVVVEKRSITLASEQLNLTQPAVSIQLKNFQQQFNIPLYEIVNQRLYITEFGMEIYDQVHLILEELEQFNQKLKWPKDKLVGKIKISVVSTGKYIAPYIISNFAQKQPGITWKLDVSNKMQVMEALEQNQVDFTMMSILPNNLNVSYVRLMPNRLFLVGGGRDSVDQTSKKHPPQYLENVPLIFRERGSGTRTMMEDFIQKNQLKVHTPFELTGNEAVKQAVMAGLGYSIMPLIGIKKELERNDLRIVDVEGLPMETSWYIVWLKQKKLSPASMSFLDFISQEFDESKERNLLGLVD